jgi:chromodomain-helicase-DNA-binding protein 4
MSVERLLSYPYAKKALTEYQSYSSRRKRTRAREHRDYKEPSSDDEIDNANEDAETPRAKRRRTLALLASKVGGRQSQRQLRSKRTGQLVSLREGYREDESDISFESAATRRSTRERKPVSSLRYEHSDFTDEFSESEEETSGRTSRRCSAKPRAKKVAERFAVEEGTEFAKKHQYWCMASSDFEAIEEDDPREYVQCQGCSFMFHVECEGLDKGHRRKLHDIIVVSEEEEKVCVLQCGRCKGIGKNGAVTMRCFVCAEMGDRSGDFEHPAKSPDNPLEGWNDPAKVMFRCMTCNRACHFNHLPPPPPKESTDSDEMQIDSDPLQVYTTPHWRCNECRTYDGKKVDVVLGWRPLPQISDHDDFLREYLVKFDGESYARVQWVPATWLAGVSFQMKSNFDGKELFAIESAKDVVLDSWLHADIMFDVAYEDDKGRESMVFRSVEEETEAISQVTSALCKWQKLTYEECIPPFPPLYLFQQDRGLTWDSDVGTAAKGRFTTMARLQSCVQRARPRKLDPHTQLPRQTKSLCRPRKIRRHNPSRIRPSPRKERTTCLRPRWKNVRLSTRRNEVTPPLPPSRSISICSCADWEAGFISSGLNGRGVSWQMKWV